MEVDNPLEQYVMLSVIGKGSYAKVFLVRKKANGALYALKSMKKKYIEQKNQQGRILTEKEILATINHQFLVKLSSSFQTEKKLFFVLQYCPGGQLFGILSKRKRFPQQQTRFYAAQIVVALKYLHSKGIIYRDLKPQNILIDAQGYIKLTDFGLSRVKTEGDSQAFSICGTPQYLAPQVLKKQGHGRAVDWWCLGSIIYELSYGLPPFYSKNRAELFNRIKNGNPYIPANWSDQLKSIVNLLLAKNPTERIKNIENIQKHQWFSSLDWQMLLNRKIKAPFVPVLKQPEDISNFDKEFTQCSLQSQAQSLQNGKKLQGFSYEKSPVQQMMQSDDEQGIITMEIQQ